jgi:hypothetical protein
MRAVLSSQVRSPLAHPANRVSHGCAFIQRRRRRRWWGSRRRRRRRWRRRRPWRERRREGALDAVVRIVGGEEQQTLGVLGRLPPHDPLEATCSWHHIETSHTQTPGTRIDVALSHKSKALPRARGPEGVNPHWRTLARVHGFDTYGLGIVVTDELIVAREVWHLRDACAGERGSIHRGVWANSRPRRPASNRLSERTIQRSGAKGRVRHRVRKASSGTQRSMNAVSTAQSGQ